MRHNYERRRGDVISRAVLVMSLHCPRSNYKAEIELFRSVVTFEATTELRADAPTRIIARSTHRSRAPSRTNRTIPERSRRAGRRLL